ncbi:MAG: polyphosphate polymerase domain-containing protein [Bacteroidales bacterium]|nr:polyphosphate polymerase domain-containing protein [Bacteroidales bacterium]
MKELEQLLHLFKPVSLEEMAAVKLMNRVDTKYMVSITELESILRHLQAHYYVQVVNNEHIIPYSTLYYDTDDVQMYMAHHNKKLCRQKLRSRIYGYTENVFCEVKQKNNHGRTKKKRIAIHKEEWQNMLQQPYIVRFVQQYIPYPVSDLKAQVQTDFKRITMVNYDKTERITIDTDITFYNHATCKHAFAGNLVIMELKQDARKPSFFKQVLFDMRIKPRKISKYCLGTILTRPQTKANRFKEKLLFINRLNNN